MRRLPILRPICLLAVFAGSVVAAEEELSLFSRTGWVQLHLVLGRVTVANIRSSQTRSAAIGEPDGELREKLSISADTVIPSVRYQRITPQEMLAAEIINGNCVRIRRVPIEPDSEGLRFDQIPGRDIVLQIGGDTSGKTYRAPSVWHLLLEQPKVCTQHLLPILEWLQPKWRLVEFAAQAEDELLLRTKTNEFAVVRLTQTLVRQLGSDDYGMRRAAHQDLRELGVVILPSLRQIDRTELSAEQRQRMDRLQKTLRVGASDTPARVADWLVEDERTWLAMLEHRERAVRKIAAAHLSKRFPKAFLLQPGITPRSQVTRLAKLKAKYEVR